MTTPPPAPGRQEQEQRFGALRTVAMVLRIVAWIVLIGGIIASVIGGIQSFGYAVGSGLAALIGGLVATAVGALVLFAYAELISLGLAIEHNTWRAAEGQGGRGGSPLP